MLTRSPRIVIWRPPARQAKAQDAQPVPAVVRPPASTGDAERDAIDRADLADRWFQDVKRKLENR